MPDKRIFIVEDEGIIAADLADRLKSLGYQVAGTAASGEEALIRIHATKPDLVLMDIILRGALNGIEVADRVRQEQELPVVFLTSHADTSTLSRACRAEPMGYLLKPFEERELRVTIELALYRHQSERKLHNMERRLATMLKSIGDGVIATDTGGCITFLNPVAEQLTGWTELEAMGRDLMEVFEARSEASGELIANPALQTMREGVTINISPNTRLHRRDGHRVPIDDSAASIRDDKDRTTGAVVSFRDCSERMRAEAEIRQINEQLEQRVQVRTAELTEANKELESFSYSVSHDLRAPLRAISGFSGILTERHQQELSPEAQRLLGIISKSAAQMGRMVDDFLNLARVGRQGLHVNPIINMNLLVQEVLAEFRLEGRRPAPQVNVWPLPNAGGDHTLLRQVWTNLLSNAVKFSGKHQHPVIEISGSAADGEVIYHVRDNGAGFDMEYAGKLFGTFSRLHSSEEFEGTGVGLAIVHRIIHRHGGRIWAEGKKGDGATFHFTLPSVPLEPRNPDESAAPSLTVRP